MSKFKVGDLITPASVEMAYRVGDVTLGKAYLVTDTDEAGPLFADNAGDIRSRMDSEFNLVTPAAPAFTVLDDAGRAALKVGDRVLLEVTIAQLPDDDREFQGLADGFRAPGMSLPPYFLASAVYALLSSAPKPIEPGQKVLILNRDKGRVLAQASDGTWAVEYEAGDGVKVGQYDASCLEVQS